MREFFGASAFFEVPTQGVSDADTPAPMRPKSGISFMVRNAVTLDPLANGTTQTDGYWRYTTNDDSVIAIQVSSDGTEWSEVFYDQTYLLDVTTAPLIVPSTDTRSASSVQNGSIGWGTDLGSRVLKVAQNGEWVPYTSGVSTQQMTDADAVVTANLKAYVEQRIAAVSTGTTGGSTATGSATPTLTYTNLYTTSFDTSTGWQSSKPGSTISGGALIVGGNWGEGKMYYDLPGVIPGRRIRVTYTIAPDSTGSMFAMLDFIDTSTSNWQWIDGVDSVNCDQLYGKSKTFVAEATVPAGTTRFMVGVVCDSGSTVVTDLTVDQSTTIAPANITSAVGSTTVGKLPFPANMWAFQNVKSWPVDPNSAAIVKSLTDEIASLQNGTGAVAAQIYTFTSCLWIIDNTTPKTNWFYNNVCNWTWTPTDMMDGIKYNTGVPTPAALYVPGAEVTYGDSSGWSGPDGTGFQVKLNTDKAVAIYNRDTGQLWDMWIAWKDKASGQWGDQQGYRIDSVATWDGRYTKLGTGVSGGGLSHHATNITVEDIQAGKIEHAMCLEIMNPKSSGMSGAFVWPATRSDGDPNNTNTNALPYGARLRLKAGAVKPTGMHKIAGIVWDALNNGYPLVVGERSSWTAIGFDGDAQWRTMNNMQDRWGAQLGSAATYDVFRGFPWNDLEVVQLGYGQGV